MFTFIRTGLEYENLPMKTDKLPSIFFTAWLLASPALCSASELDELKARVAALEARLTSLVKSLQPSIAKAKTEQLRAAQQLRARKRMRQDSTNYTRDELRSIESLYQVANKQWGTEQARESLRTLVQKYGKANRTGCAILYLGQMSHGKEKIQHLQHAIEQFGDCFYGDGVQVGAYARFLLGQDYLSHNQPRKAKKRFDEIRDQYPDAIDHRGNSLVALLPE